MDTILYVSYVRQGGGDWVHTREFLGALRQLHGSVSDHLPRITENRREAGGRVDGPTADPLREIRYLAGLFFTRLGEQWRLLQSVKPDIVIFRTCRYTSLILLCRMLRIPIILEVNAPMLERKYLDVAERFRWLPFWCRLEASVFAQADHLLVVSDVLKGYYAGFGIAAAGMTTVPNGVDVRRFHPRIDGGPIRRRLGIDQQVVIGFSGSFTPWHGFDFLIDALDQLIGSHPKLREKIVLMLVGNAHGKMREINLRNLRTVMTGQVPYLEMPAYLAAMDVVAAPYPRVEPFYFSPLKIVEAMAMGRPVIASAQGQIKQLLHDNFSGMLYAPGNLDEFNQKLLYLIENPEKRRILGEKARDRIVCGFTWRHNAERILGICNRLIKNRRRKR